MRDKARKRFYESASEREKERRNERERASQFNRQNGKYIIKSNASNRVTERVLEGKGKKSP